MAQCSLLVSFGLAMLLQTPASPPVFDVTSVKPSLAQFPSGLKINPGRLAASGVTLSELIQQAYGVSEPRLSGVPFQFGLFDVEGKSEGSHSQSELLQMLQTLLADRFKLKLHRETKEMPVEALVTGKNATRFEPSSGEGEPVISVHPGQSVGKISYEGEKVELPFVANYVSNRLRRVVVDQTGLAGTFDFKTALAVDRAKYADPNIPEQDLITRLMTEFVSQLGLKLESRRASVEILVIDHAEKPDSN